ncbi:MAG: ATP-binding cassette domain-containing protein [Bacteroidota bacterium]
MIKLDKVVKQFGTQPVLRGISAEFLPGRIYGVIGENGAGKTTLFRCIADLIPYGGNISKPLRLGFLQTNNYFLPKMTGREYLRLLCQARKLPAEDLDARNVFDLPLDEYAENYSTGMKKKLALLGVLLQQNELLILDEPYNGVDIQSNMLITAILLELKHLGKTVLISSHIFSTLSDTCDEIFLLREGNFAKHAQPEEFARLEREMVGKTVGDRVQKLLLT